MRDRAAALAVLLPPAVGPGGGEVPALAPHPPPYPAPRPHPPPYQEPPPPEPEVEPPPPPPPEIERPRPHPPPYPAPRPYPYPLPKPEPPPPKKEEPAPPPPEPEVEPPPPPPPEIERPRPHPPPYPALRPFEYALPAPEIERPRPHPQPEYPPAPEPPPPVVIEPALLPPAVLEPVEEEPAPLPPEPEVEEHPPPPAGGGGAAPAPAEKEEAARMVERLLGEAKTGVSTLLMLYARDNRDILLLGTTPSGNTCLHIAAIHGHQQYCQDAAVALGEGGPSLFLSILTKTNSDGETPLATAVRSGSVAVATAFLRRCQAIHRTNEQLLLEAGQPILIQDKDGCNALHHAIRCGHRALALELIAAEPELSTHVNDHGESPMFAAAMRDFTDVAQGLLDTPGCLHVGPFGHNSLHAAARNGNSEIVRGIMRKCPELAGQSHNNDLGNDFTPVCTAVYRHSVDVLREFLAHDPSLGYQETRQGYTLLHVAAAGGHVDIARELLTRCPDAPCRGTNVDGWTCLHTAVWYGYADFVKFILTTPQLRKVVNMQTYDGMTALHFAVQKCDPEIVKALLSHQDIDPTVMDNTGVSPAWTLRSDFMDRAKTLNLNKVVGLMLKADQRGAGSINNLLRDMTRLTTDASRKDAQSLTQIYTSNTSLVAILVTTVTFAAAFTLPGGYSAATGSEGHPIMARKAAFQAFVISDTVAMCSSFVVAFICIIARWKDYEFLLYYRSFTKKLMWFAYIATTTAFSTGLYTVLAPHLQWLAIAICVLVASLPIITWLLGTWPVLKLKFRLGKTFNYDLLHMV